MLRSERVGKAELSSVSITVLALEHKVHSCHMESTLLHIGRQWNLCFFTPFVTSQAIPNLLPHRSQTL